MIIVYHVGFKIVYPSIGKIILKYFLQIGCFILLFGLLIIHVSFCPLDKKEIEIKVRLINRIPGTIFVIQYVLHETFLRKHLENPLWLLISYNEQVNKPHAHVPTLVNRFIYRSQWLSRYTRAHFNPPLQTMHVNQLIDAFFE